MSMGILPLASAVRLWTLFADAVFESAYNPKVDRYIPIEEIRAALKNGIGMKCDVDQYIGSISEKGKRGSVCRCFAREYNGKGSEGVEQGV